MTLLLLRKKLVRRRSFSVVTIGNSGTAPSRSQRLTRSNRGGFVVWRAAQWYPDLVSHVFSVCTPYTAPHREYFSTEDLVKGQLPQFAYQLHLASGEVEKSVKDEQSIKQFLRGMYGARGPNGELAFDPEKGVLAENLPIIGESRILNGKVSAILLYSRSSEGYRSRSAERQLSGQLEDIEPRGLAARRPYSFFCGRRADAEEASKEPRRRVSITSLPQS